MQQLLLICLVVGCDTPAGKPKESQARSCHQEVVRQAKTVSTGHTTVGGSDPDACSPSPQLHHAAMVAANGYLAAAELCLQLCLPALANQLLELAAGESIT